MRVPWLCQTLEQHRRYHQHEYADPLDGGWQRGERDDNESKRAKHGPNAVHHAEDGVLVAGEDGTDEEVSQGRPKLAAMVLKNEHNQHKRYADAEKSDPQTTSGDPAVNLVAVQRRERPQDNAAIGHPNTASEQAGECRAPARVNKHVSESTFLHWPLATGKRRPASAHQKG